MALLDSEGFGSSTSIGDYVTYNLIKSGGSGIATGGPFGDNYCGFGRTINAMVFRSLPSSYTTLFFGARMRVNGTYGAVTFYSPLGGIQASMVIVPSTGIITAFRGDQAVALGATSTNTVSFGWTYIEAGIVIDAVNGSFAIRVNGVNVLNLTNVNTKGDGSSSSIAWTGFYIPEFSAGTDMTHIYFCDNTGAAPWNTFLGDVRVQTLFPNGAGATTNFTPVGLGTNWQNAAAVPAQPSVNYNTDATTNDIDLFTIPNVSAVLSNIFGVKVSALGYKADAGNRSAAAVLKSGATTVVGTPVGLGSSPQYMKLITQVDPNTSAQWTISNVNVSQPGYKIVS